MTTNTTHRWERRSGQFYKRQVDANTIEITNASGEVVAKHCREAGVTNVYFELRDSLRSDGYMVQYLLDKFLTELAGVEYAA